MQRNLRRNKLHRTNQGSNFLGGSFSNRDNIRASIQFRREIQPVGRRAPLRWMWKSLNPLSSPLEAWRYTTGRLLPLHKCKHHSNVVPVKQMWFKWNNIFNSDARTQMNPNDPKISLNGLICPYITVNDLKWAEMNLISSHFCKIFATDPYRCKTWHMLQFLKHPIKC